MKQLSSIEQSLAKAFKDVPHLPKGFTDWVADNLWWLVIIGVVFGAFGTLTAFSALILFGGTFAAIVGGPVAGAALVTSGLVNVILLAGVIVIEAMAIQPLKLKQKRGWDLLLLASLVAFAGSVVVAVLGFHISSILWTAVGTAIGLYILFEIRGHFVVAKVADKK